VCDLTSPRASEEERDRDLVREGGRWTQEGKEMSEARLGGGREMGGIGDSLADLYSCCLREKAEGEQVTKRPSQSPRKKCLLS